jgi:hypothetical protein
MVQVKMTRNETGLVFAKSHPAAVPIALGLIQDQLCHHP